MTPILELASARVLLLAAWAAGGRQATVPILNMHFLVLLE